MTMKKLFCAVLALILALGCACAFAEDDVQAKLKAAEARIAELEAQVALYKPFYDAQIVAAYGVDGIITLDAVQAEYDSQVAYLAQYGIDVAQYGWENEIKTEIVQTAVQTAVLDQKAEEMNIELDADKLAELEAAAQEMLNNYYTSYYQYYYPDAEEITEAMTAEAAAYWAQNGLDHDTYYDSLVKDAVQDVLHDEIVKDVAITEEDVQAAYEARVESNKTAYANDSSYNNDRNNGVAIAWNPEGYRAVKHVLVKFDDDQSARYTDLQNTLKSLNAEKEALANPPAETAEDAPEPRTAAEIDADIAECAKEIEALYAQLEPKANEVVAAFENGTSFEDLIAAYNEDPGMNSEPIATIGYAVREGSTAWDPAFTAGAMSIEGIGCISAPVRGSYGFYIIYYLDDITPGEVGLEAIRADIEAEALNNKIQKTYDDQVAAWVEETHPVYYLANFGVTE